METISGSIERVTFYNDENGYSVVKIKADKRFPEAEARDGTLTVVGTMPELGTGETVQFTGMWIEDTRYGRQFRAEMVTPLLPTTENGIVNYLASGIVRGIGIKTAEKIVSHFGTRTLDILDNYPERLDEVPAVKRELLAALKKAWSENQSIRQTMIYLQGHGVSSKMSARIFQYYGSSTISTVESNPYALADEVFGIGFMKADTIARNMGVQADAPNRIRAGLEFTLAQLTRDGHVFSPRQLLVEKAAEILKVEDTDLIREILDQELAAGALVVDQVIAEEGKLEAIYLENYYKAEQGAVERLRLLNNTPSALMEAVKPSKWGAFIQTLAEQAEVSLTSQQQGAVKAAIFNKVSVLTGGPGTGKTTTLHMVIEALEELDFKYALASPTGRAAKRLSEATGRSASTIHRLLGYIPGEGFDLDEDNPLEVDILIVDESSMIDLLLFYDVLRALKPEAHLVLVGDVDQLPSVGAGNVLRDVIDGEIAHVTRLQTIFRQGDDSMIVVNAHRINSGEAPHMDNKSNDFYFFGQEDPALITELVVDIVKNRLPSRFGFNPLEDVQVISPMYRGAAGVNALNEALQGALNGDKLRVAEKQLGGKLLRVGDKVMQTKNNYEKEVFNGDTGRIRAIDFDDQSIDVLIDNRIVPYDWIEADELIHSYCISTHRSQGSEYPVVVMPLMTQHYMMLQRNLLYTAITRAKKMVVLVGSRKAVFMAVGNNKVAERYSGLVSRLRDLY